MNAIAIISDAFDYGALTPKKAADLRLAAERIRTTLRQNIIDIGKELIAVKDQIDHGHFCRWLKAEFTMSERTAENYMAAAELAISKSETFSVLPATILYKLGSTSPKAREEVITRLERGEKLSLKAITLVIRTVRNDERREERKQARKDARSARAKRRTREEEQHQARQRENDLRIAQAAEAADEIVGLLRECLSAEDLQRLLDLARIIGQGAAHSLLSIVQVAVGPSHGNGHEHKAAAS